MKQANNQASSESRTCQATRCHAAFACRWPSTSNHPKKSQRTKQLKLPGTSISHGARQRIDRSSSFELVSSTGACLSSQQFARPPPPLQERHGEGFQGPGNRRRLQNREEEQQHQRGLAQPCSTIELPTSRQTGPRTPRHSCKVHARPWLPSLARGRRQEPKFASTPVELRA